MRDYRHVVILSIALIVATAWAGGVPTPLELPGGRLVDTPEVFALIEAGGVQIYDVRYPINFGRGHLPGAHSLPYRGRSQNHSGFNPADDPFPLQRLPSERTTPLIFYSHGDTGWKSYKAASQAIRAGYRQVLWYRGGFQAWVKAGHLPAAGDSEGGS